MWPLGRKIPASPLGLRGEKLAIKALKKAGLKILAHNYRCPAGEADIIALDRSTKKSAGGETICFVEVKTRSDDTYIDPQAAVNADKQRRLRKIAKYYLATRKVDVAAYSLRFDIVAVVAKDGEKPLVKHIPGAFE